MNKLYLGDSVYCEFDESHLVLTTENGLPEDPSNRIALGPHVYSALLQYVNKLDLIGNEWKGWRKWEKVNQI